MFCLLWSKAKRMGDHYRYGQYDGGYFCLSAQTQDLCHIGNERKLSPYIATVTDTNSRSVIGNENGNLVFHVNVLYETYIQNCMKHDRIQMFVKPPKLVNFCHLTKFLDF